MGYFIYQNVKSDKPMQLEFFCVHLLVVAALIIFLSTTIDTSIIIINEITQQKASVKKITKHKCFLLTKPRSLGTSVLNLWVSESTVHTQCSEQPLKRLAALLWFPLGVWRWLKELSANAYRYPVLAPAWCFNPQPGRIGSSMVELKSGMQNASKIPWIEPARQCKATEMLAIYWMLTSCACFRIAERAEDQRVKETDSACK